MIIICPACTTHFTAPREAIGEDGRMVKCSRCGHSWYYDPRVEEQPEEALPEEKVAAEAAEEADPFAMLLEEEQPDDSGDEPLRYEPVNAVEVPPKQAGVLLKLGAVASLLLAITTGLIAHHEHYPMLSDLFEGIGLQNTDGLGFTRLEVERKPLGDQLELWLEGEISNDADTIRVMPDVVITLLSKQGREIGRLTYPVQKDLLEPGETVIITPEITNIPSLAKHLVLDIGNAWELSFRQ